MDGKIRYEFISPMWKHTSTGSWYFISLPIDTSKEIREALQWQEEGWGRMKVVAEIGEIQWKTSIWFDTKMQRYLLPVKAEIRKKSNIKCDQDITLSLMHKKARLEPWFWNIAY